MNKELKYIDIEQVVANRYQPRTIFNQSTLQELAQSIIENGLIQPITVRPIINDKYEIVAGERRFKAACLAGYLEVPCIIQEYDDTKLAEVALVENIQRENLTPIEEAEAYKQLLEITQSTQSELAIKVGKKQSTIANKLRLLQLPEDIKTALKNRQINERHARAVLSLNNPEEMSETVKNIINDQLTVKQTEEIIADKIPKKRANKKVKGITQNIKIAINTIKQAVNMVKKVGINVVMDEENQENEYKITITIKKF
jgi:ParB-like partition proteins